MVLEPALTSLQGWVLQGQVSQLLSAALLTLDHLTKTEQLSFLVWPLGFTCLERGKLRLNCQICHILTGVNAVRLGRFNHSSESSSKILLQH